MKALSYLKDVDFLRALDNDNNKFYWVKIEVLDMDERPLRSIEGRVLSDSVININGDSSLRRTCDITFIAEEAENNLTDIDNLLSINKKIKIFEGFKNNITKTYDDIIWFPLGVYVIVNPSITHDLTSVNISLSCQDKMCLLNGQNGGTLPTSVTFGNYDQIIGLLEVNRDPETISDLDPNNYTVYKYTLNGENKYKTWSKKMGWEEQDDDSLVGTTVSVPQLIYDIIQTLVCNFGGEKLDKIFINDVPLEIKQIVRYMGESPLYYNGAAGNTYTLDSSAITKNNYWQEFNYNEDVGYVYTDFVYPGELTSNIGDNVCSILDQIINVLGNYEYFYDIEGNFVFQEIKNYLNTSYEAVDEYELDGNREVEIATNDLNILNSKNYQVDFYSNTKTVYNFTEGNGLISSIVNTPNYNNIKNDFHIWGTDNDENAIHYHVAIKKQPRKEDFGVYKIIKLSDEDTEYPGQIRLANKNADGTYETGTVSYKPDDWRAELYLRGLVKQKNQQRPDIYEQELLDLFDAIYNFQEKKFRVDLVKNPNELKYFLDYLEPIDKMYDCSVDTLGTKIYSYQQDQINKIYNKEIPNVILVNLGIDQKTRNKIIARCENEGQASTNINADIYSDIVEGMSGYSAQDNARELLYQYTDYSESISIQSIPIYYLDVNSRITVQDKKAGIYGDYIIKTISLPLNASSAMSITAIRALERF